MLSGRLVRDGDPLTGAAGDGDYDGDDDDDAKDDGDG